MACGAGKIGNPHVGRKIVPQAQGGPGLQALQSLCLIARLHQVAADPAALAHQLGLSPSEPVDVPDLLRAAKSLGLKARKVSCGVERLALTPLPALALLRESMREPDREPGVAGEGNDALAMAFAPPCSRNAMASVCCCRSPGERVGRTSGDRARRRVRQALDG